MRDQAKRIAPAPSHRAIQLLRGTRILETERWRALQLMDHAAKVMSEFKDIVLAFGESDEYRSARLPPNISTHAQLAFSSENPPIRIIATTQKYYPPSRPISHRVIYSTGPDVFRIPCCAIRPLSYPDERAIRDYFAWR